MLTWLARRLPLSVIAALNRAQFRPIIGRPLRALAVRSAGSGVIGRGAGAGLLLDATGTNPGYLLGTTEPDEQAWLAARLCPGDVFYDVGANIGFHTVIAARLVGNAGTVVAFEPLPENAAQLRRNVELNSFANVEVVEAALSDGTGFANLSGSGHRTRRTLTKLGGVEVRTFRLDDWEGPPPDLLKIDVEGAELVVLEGALETIRRHRPDMLIEVHWLADAFTRFFRDELEPLGYVGTTLEGEPLPEEPVRYHAVLACRSFA